MILAITRFMGLMALLAMLTLFNLPTAQAATITVNTTVDENGTGANCSLREAVLSANANADTGGCSASGYGTDTITLPTGTYTLSAGSALSITSAITIQPAVGATVIVQAAVGIGGAAYRVFDVTATGNLTISGMTVRNGGQFSLAFLQNGGCVRVTSGVLLVTGGTILENCRTPFEGGAVAGEGAGNSITINGGSILRGNIAGDDGGGVKSLNGSLSLNGVTIRNNQALGGISDAALGGGVSYEGETLSIANTSIVGNSATDVDGGIGAGGGISMRLITVNIGVGTITGSTISDNLATGTTDSLGGGIYKFGSGALTITDSAIERNQATGGSGNQHGGGIYNLVGPIIISGSRIQDNSTASTGGAYYVVNVGAGESITNSCIVANSDTAVVSTDVLNATDNWWGDASGARSTTNPASFGDSVSGDGTTPVNATGFKTMAPTLAGLECQGCIADISALGDPRYCEIDPP